MLSWEEFQANLAFSGLYDVVGTHQVHYMVQNDKESSCPFTKSDNFVEMIVSRWPSSHLKFKFRDILGKTHVSGPVGSAGATFSAIFFPEIVRTWSCTKCHMENGIFVEQPQFCWLRQSEVRRKFCKKTPYKPPCCRRMGFVGADRSIP